MDLGALAPRWHGLRLTHRPVGDADLRVLEADDPGPGVPHVLLHGLGASALSWVDVAPAIAERGPVVAPDLTGFGLSEPPSGHRVTVDSAVEPVVALLDDLGHDRVVLHGSSLGGFLAGRVAARAPERVAGLVLASPALPVRPRRPCRCPRRSCSASGRWPCRRSARACSPSRPGGTRTRDAARDEVVATARRFVELGLVTPGVRMGDRFVELSGQLEQLLRDPGTDHVWLRNRRQGDEVTATFS